MSGIRQGTGRLARLQALRTETTSNGPLDFALGKRLHNLPALRAVGFQANRRLLDVQRCSHDYPIGDDARRQVTRPPPVSCVPVWPASWPSAHQAITPADPLSTGPESAHRSARSLVASRSRSTSRIGGAPKSLLYSRLKCEASS